MLYFLTYLIASQSLSTLSQQLRFLLFGCVRVYEIVETICEFRALNIKVSTRRN